VSSQTNNRAFGKLGRELVEEAKLRGWAITIQPSGKVRWMRPHTRVVSSTIHGLDNPHVHKNIESELLKAEQASGYDHCSRHKLSYRRSGECPQCFEQRQRAKPELRVVPKVLPNNQAAPLPAAQPYASALSVAKPEKVASTVGAPEIAIARSQRELFEQASPPPPPPPRTTRRNFRDGVVPYADVAALVDLGMETGRWATRTALLRDAGYTAVTIMHNWRKQGVVAARHFETLRLLIEDNIKSVQVPGSAFRVPLTEQQFKPEARVRQPTPDKYLKERVLAQITRRGTVSHTTLYQHFSSVDRPMVVLALEELVGAEAVTREVIETSPGHFTRLYHLPSTPGPAPELVQAITEAVAEPKPAPAPEPEPERSPLEQIEYAYTVRALLAFAAGKAEREAMSNRIVAKLTRLMGADSD